MQFFKTFGLLLLLTLSNTGIASAYDSSLLPAQVEQEEYQFSQDYQNLFESTLITPAEVQTNRTLIPVAIVPEHLCPRIVSQATSYYIYSRTIIPSLDIAAIIFPFHSFL